MTEDSINIEDHIETPSYINDIWVVKYRPANLNDVVGHQRAINMLRNMIHKKNVMSILFAGPPGTGKTATAEGLGKELYGETYKSNFAELNASDERGIDVVRNTIKSFAKTKPIGTDIPFKIMFLDEADALTSDAQSALRRTMEKAQRNCRFILSCNYPEKLIGPIQSRCLIVPFPKLSHEENLQLVNRVIENEGLDIDDSAKDYLVEACDGDARRMITALQSCTFMGIDGEIPKITTLSLSLITRVPSSDVVRRVIEFAQENNLIEARNAVVNEFINQGLDPLHVLKVFDIELSKRTDLHPIMLSKQFEALGQAVNMLSQSMNPDIQLKAYISTMTTLFQLRVTHD